MTCGHGGAEPNPSPSPKPQTHQAWHLLPVLQLRDCVHAPQLLILVVVVVAERIDGFSRGEGEDEGWVQLLVVADGLRMGKLGGRVMLGKGCRRQVRG